VVVALVKIDYGGSVGERVGLGQLSAVARRLEMAVVRVVVRGG